MIKFAKVESIGNDFVLVDAPPLSPRERGQGGEGCGDYAQLAIKLCSRHFCIGSDGLLVVAQSEGGVGMRMFNPDGTEDFCGNGLRCAAVYAAEKGWVGSEFSILHGGQHVPVSVSGSEVRTTIAPASFASAAVPFLPPSDELFQALFEVEGHSLNLSALTTGSTHAVLTVDELPAENVFQLVSSRLEHHPTFPERTSVIWSRADDSHNLAIRIWERGVGETLGCGTGSSAAAVVHARASGLSGTVSVHNPGGTVQVSLPSWDGPITIEGTARIVFEGEADLGD